MPLCNLCRQASLLLTRPGVVKNVSLMAAGTGLAQLITIAATPIITRLYSAESLGIFGLFMAVSSMLGTLATGRYNLAIMLPKTDNEAIKAVVLCLTIALLTTFLCALFIPLNQIIASYLKVPELAVYFALFPVVIFLLGINQTFEVLLSRDKAFSAIAITAITASIFSNTFKVGMGVFKPSTAWLIVGSILFFLTNAILFLCYLKRFHQKMPAIKGIVLSFSHISTYKVIAKKYIHLPKYRMPKDLLASVVQNSPLVLLAFFFSPVQVAYFALADKILRLPSFIIGQSIRKVLYQKLNEIYNNNKNMTYMIKKYTLAMLIIGFLPFGFIIALGPELFNFVFGDQWDRAGEYARWVSVWLYFTFINIPSIVSVPILNIEKEILAIELYGGAIRISGLIVGGHVFSNAYLSVVLFCIFGALFNVYTIYFVIKKVISNDKHR